jgi:hypothetical protein
MARPPRRTDRRRLPGPIAGSIDDNAEPDHAKSTSEFPSRPGPPPYFPPISCRGANGGPVKRAPNAHRGPDLRAGRHRHSGISGISELSAYPDTNSAIPAATLGQCERQLGTRQDIHGTSCRIELFGYRRDVNARLNLQNGYRAVRIRSSLGDPQFSRSPIHLYSRRDHMEAPAHAGT